MIVDDLPMHRARVRELMANAGYRCIEATNGAEAVQLYEAEAPDAVLMDLEMPVMDGIGALRAIREDDPSARIAMLSQYGSRAAVELAKEFGAVDYILKTASNQDVLNCVRTLLREPARTLVG